MDTKLPPESLRALDQLRQRLAQLTTGIASLRKDLSAHTLPTYPQLHSAAQLLSYTLTQYNEAYTAHKKFLTEAHAYPLPTYPGLGEAAAGGRSGLSEEEGRGALEYVLRKKLEPRCEVWIDAHVEPRGKKEEGKEEVRELWKWAGSESVGVLRKFVEKGHFEADFTVAEMESGVDEVKTGLRRKLEGQLEEDSEDEDMEKEDEEDEQAVRGVWDGGEPGIEIETKGLGMDEWLNILSTAGVHSTSGGAGGTRR